MKANINTRKNLPQSHLPLTIFLLCCGIAFFTGGCATSQPKESPFRVPKATIRETVKTVAIYHAVNQQPIEGEFARLIGAKLREAGFRVIEPSQITPIVAKERGAVGGVFDPQTGKVVQAKADALSQNILKEIQAKFNADAYLVFHVVSRPIQYRALPAGYGAVRWDGTTERLFAGSPLAGRTTFSGTAQGISLKVMLRDMQGITLWENYGGIQLGSKLRTQLGGATFEKVLASELFTDANRNQNAVNIALDPLVK